MISFWMPVLHFNDVLNIIETVKRLYPDYFICQLLYIWCFKAEPAFSSEIEISNFKCIKKLLKK